MQHRDETSARVLRIDVDGVAAKRTEGDLRGAQSWSSRDGNAARFEDLREQLAQQIRFAEWLGRNDDWRECLRRQHRGEQRAAEDDARTPNDVHDATRLDAAVIARSTSVLTYVVAGARCRSAN